MKKFSIIIIIILCVTSIIYIKTIQNKSKDINYAIEYNLTKKLFNQVKLCKVSKITVVFSDNTISVVEVSGVEKKAPYKTINLKMFLKKTTKGYWKVKELYSMEE